MSTDAAALGSGARPDRCSLRGRERHDPMLGTAFPADRVLMVEQPGGWGIEGLQDSRFDPQLAARLVSTMSRRSTRVLAIRRPGRLTPDARRTWGYADTRPGHQGLVWGRFESDEELLAIDPDAVLSGEVAMAAASAAHGDTPIEPPPAFLVCAHGTHDVCCAIEGRPVAAELQRRRPGQVWECSHLGGDRFAANVLVLPLGVLYGRIGVAQVDDLLATTERRELMIGSLRGRVGLTSVAQAGLAFAHTHLGRLGVDELRVVEVRPGPEDGAEHRWTVRVETPDGALRVDVGQHPGTRDLLTCRADVPSRGWVFELVSVDAE
jgi:hypothetical protein